MYCKASFMQGTLAYQCGRCLPCRINNKVIWVNRMVLESLTHDQNCFTTLTYEHAPEGNSVNPKHTQAWLKRLRKEMAPRRLRFYVVGEYGSQTQRPHYHACLFGLGPLDGPAIHQTWGLGHTHVGDFNSATAGYTCGYVLKRMTHKNDERLQGRHPEFARSSNRPGLGAPAMVIMGEALHSPAGLNEMEKIGDVPHKLKIGGKNVYLGRYLINYLRKEVGLPEKWLQAIKQKNAVKQGLEMLEMWETHKKNPTVFSYPAAHLAENQGSIWSLEGRAKIGKAQIL